MSKQHSIPLIFPAKVLDQHLVMLGKTGAGKSSALRHIVEHLLAGGKRVCVIDPKGDWWGLKASADGKSAGFPVIAFGDFKNEAAQDVPINERSGKHVAELIATGNRPCLIGFRGWMPGAMHRFWIDFASTLFNTNVGELYLVGDEFHNFAPKGKVLSPEVGKCLHWSNRLLSEGRGLGIVCLLASQRPQKVHNDTLTSCETLVAMRVIHKADRDAVKDWIDGAGDAKRGTEVLNALAQMPRGEAYVWSPEISFGPERLAFPLFTTFDSFAPPQLQKKVSRPGWADVNLDEVKQQLAEVIEEEKAKDPKALTQTIRELKQQLAAAQQAVPTPAAKVVTKTVEKPVLKDQQVSRLEKACEAMKTTGEKLIEQGNALKNQALSIKETIQRFIAPPIDRPILAARPLPQAAVNPRTFFLNEAHTSHVPKRERRAAPAETGDLTRPQKRLLDAIAWWNSIKVPAPSRSQVGFVAGIKPTGGHFTNTIGPLSTRGLIEYTADGVRLTAAGADLAELPDTKTTLTSYHAMIRQLLKKGPAQRIFDAIIAQRGNPISIADIGQAAGIDPAGGHFTNSIGPLGTLGLIDRRDGIATPTWLLFPGGLS